MAAQHKLHEDLAKEFSLDGRVAVVTGAGSGIGRETARVLMQAGARVVIADINEGGLAETAKMLGGDAKTVLTRRTDVAKKADVDALADQAVAKMGGIDVWVNTAGIIMRVPIVNATEADVDRMISVNLKGVYWGTAAAGRAMMTKKSGSIINFSSTGGEYPGPEISLYSLTKAAVIMLSRSAAMEFGPHGIRVNSIGPGWIDTPMGTQTFRNERGEMDPRKLEEGLRVRKQSSPLGLLGTPLDIALAVLYLASDASRFVTGQLMRPNGGVLMT